MQAAKPGQHNSEAEKILRPAAHGSGNFTLQHNQPARRSAKGLWGRQICRHQRDALSKANPVPKAGSKSRTAFRLMTLYWASASDVESTHRRSLSSTAEQQECSHVLRIAGTDCTNSEVLSQRV